MRISTSSSDMASLRCGCKSYRNELANGTERIDEVKPLIKARATSPTKGRLLALARSAREPPETARVPAQEVSLSLLADRNKASDI